MQLGGRRTAAGFTDEKAELRTAAQAPVPPVMDVEPTLEQELHAHAGTYEETGITDPAVFKGQAELGRNMLEELPEDLSVAAGCYEETGITDPATLKR
ncbi:hypothetical protein EON62_04635 [archaeon]|nr:MAG: hypothetical protein EON62_04635 [archaeon]